MATLTLFTGTYATLTAEYNYTQNVTNNTSTLTVSMYIAPSGGATAIGRWGDSTSGSYLGTTSDTFNGSVPEGTKSKTLLRTISKTITHNSDGTSGGYTVYWKLNVASSWGGFSRPQGSFHVGFATIPRASSFTLNTQELTLGNNLVFTIARASSAFTHKLVYGVGGTYYQIAENIGTSYTWSNINAPAHRFPNQTGGNMVVEVRTYNGSTYIGSDARLVLVKIPNTAEFQPNTPSITTSIVSPVGSLAVQGTSKIRVQSAATGRYSATISSYSVTVDGKTYTGSDITTSTINSTGTITVSVKATDSRGYSKTSTQNVTFIAKANEASLSKSSGDLGTTVSVNHVLASGQTRTVTIPVVAGSSFGTYDTSTQVWTLPTSANQIAADKTSVTTNLVVATKYNGTTLRTDTLPFTATVPNNTNYQPEINQFNLTVVNDFPSSAVSSEYIQGVSKVQAATKTKGKYNATIDEVRFTVQNIHKYGTAANENNTIVSDVISTSGAVAATLRARDSRGYTRTSTTNLTVREYDNPKITNFAAVRDETDDTKVNVDFTYSMSSINGKNKGSYTLRYRQTGSGTWTNIDIASDQAISLTKNYTTGAGTFDPDNTYEVELTITDLVGKTAKLSVAVEMAFELMHFNASGKGVAFGKVSERAGTFELDLPSYINKKMQLTDDTEVEMISWEDGTEFNSYSFYNEDGALSFYHNYDYGIYGSDKQYYGYYMPMSWGVYLDFTPTESYGSTSEIRARTFTSNNVFTDYIGSEVYASSSATLYEGGSGEDRGLAIRNKTRSDLDTNTAFTGVNYCHTRDRTFTTGSSGASTDILSLTPFTGSTAIGIYFDVDLVYAGASEIVRYSGYTGIGDNGTKKAVSFKVIDGNTTNVYMSGSWSGEKLVLSCSKTYSKIFITTKVIQRPSTVTATMRWSWDE